MNNNEIEERKGITIVAVNLLGQQVRNSAAWQYSEPKLGKAAINLLN